MRISPEERFRKKIRKIGKKNKFCHVCMIPVLAAGLTWFRIISYFKGNGKRFSVLVGTLLLIVVYSSFSFPGFISGDGTGNGLNGEISEEAANITLAVEPEIDLSIISRLGDEELLGEENFYAKPVQDRDEAEANAAETAQNVPQGNTGKTEKSNRETVEFSRDDWRLLLVNKQNSVPDGYEVPLGNIHTLKGTMQCDERIIADLLTMQQDAKAEGISLDICSPHRDYEYQKRLFNGKIRNYMNLGVSYMEAYQLSSQAVMVPGASEHQLGLALDIVTKSYQNLDEGFADTDAGKWMAENCYKYGFIVRYPKGKEDITGVEYEPWHMRYVGVEAATIMTEDGITLEEFWEEYL